MENWIRNFSREMGALDSRVSGLERRIDDRLASQAKDLENLKSDLKSSSEKLDKVLSLMNQGKGGWKTLTLSGSVLVAVAAGLAWLFEKLVLGI